MSKVASTRPEKFPLNEANADLYGVERRQWEAERLLKTINTNSLSMDPTPFQLYNNTTLLKTYSMFSLLGLQRAYITKCGRLIGVVSLRDVSSYVVAKFYLDKSIITHKSVNVLHS